MIPTNIYGRGIYIIQVKIYKEETNKEYVSLLIGLYKNNGSVLHVAIRLLYI